MTSITANELLNEWQERLGLQDWAIILRFNLSEEDMQGDAGTTVWNNVNKVAEVHIIQEGDYNSIIPYDYERILVHELLHIKFGYLQIEPSNYEEQVLDEAQHQLIDDLARALVMAKRGETKRLINCDKIKDGVII
jgi:hypothetical protein